MLPVRKVHYGARLKVINTDIGILFRREFSSQKEFAPGSQFATETVYDIVNFPGLEEYVREYRDKKAGTLKRWRLNKVFYSSVHEAVNIWRQKHRAA